MIIVVTKIKNWVGKSKYDVKVIFANDDRASAVETEVLPLKAAINKINLLPMAHVVSYCAEIKNRVGKNETSAAGKNTRIIDSAIQTIFNSGSIEFDSFFNSHGDNSDTQTKITLFGKLIRRLKSEHSYKFSKMIVDFDKRTITIKTLR